MQTNILDARPEADVRVYTVWLQPYGSPLRSSWDPEVLSDPRVVHLWNANGAVGRWFAQADRPRLGFPGDVVWDAWFLFDREARWTGAPSHLVGFGWTVISTSEELRWRADRLL